MKKVFRLQDLDCANCAAKMERSILKIEGVTSASVNFMTQKLSIESSDEMFEHILDEAAKAIHKIDPDCSIIR